MDPSETWSRPHSRPLATARMRSLPGQGNGATTTPDDQQSWVLASIDSLFEKVVVVGHSAAGTLAGLAANARLDKVACTVLIGFPCADGESYADFFETVDGLMPFPGWGPFEGPDSADLYPVTRERVAAAAISVPESVCKAQVRLTDERRYGVPVTLICPEFGQVQAREWIAAGDVPELAKAQYLTLVDIDSGHWPMITRPVESACLPAEVALYQANDGR